MKKFLTLLLLLGSFIVAHADELLVCGVSVDLSKSGYVTGTGIQGTVHYDANERMLSLTNATLTTNMIGIAADVSKGTRMDFRVYLNGKNVINSGRVSVRADKNIMFCGNGDLELNGPGNFINKCKMTVYACRITVNSTGDDGFHSMPNGFADLDLAYHGALKVSCKKNALESFNDINYKSGKLLSGSPAEPDMEIGDDYLLEIGNVKVTPFNRDAVTGPSIQGNVSVEFPNTYASVKVNLKNATISDCNYGISFRDTKTPITISLTGNNTINATTRGITSHTGNNSKAYTIEGKGSDKLTVKSNTGVSHQGDLNVKNCILDFYSSVGGIYLGNYGQLTVDNATIHAIATRGDYDAILGITGVTYLNGCTETKPLRAGYSSVSQSISLQTGNPDDKLLDVTIEPTYGVIVCGHILKKSMGKEVFSITDDDITGTVNYDPEHNSLILSNEAVVGFVGEYKYHPATIEVLDFNSTVCPGAEPFTIYSTGNAANKIYDTVKGDGGSAIYSYNDIVIAGDAPLDVYSYYGINFFGKHYLNISLKSDFSDNSINHAVGSVSSSDDYFILGLNPGENATYTYRFKGELSPVFERLAVLDKPEDFTVIAPFNATYDDVAKAVVAEGQPVIDEWVVFGFPKHAEGYMSIADTDPYIKNQRIYPYLNLSFSAWCQQFYDTWKEEQHDICHIYRTKEEALNNDYTHELNWNGEVPLSKVLTLHGNIGGEFDVPIDPFNSGCQWEFELVDYNSTAYSSGTGDDQYAWLDGDVLRACSVTDGERDPNIQSKLSIGHEPLVKVQLRDVHGDLIAGGYIKFRIGNVTDDVIINVSLSEAVQYATSDTKEYRFDFYELSSKILNALHITKAEFEAYYCFAMNSSSQPYFYQLPIGQWTDGMTLTPLQRYVKYKGTWLQATIIGPINIDSSYNNWGSFKVFSSDDSNLCWTLTDSEREQLGYSQVAVRLYHPYLAFPDVYLVFSGKDRIKGDVNLDGAVDVADIGTIIDAMASGDNNSDYDVNEDGAVDVADIATIIDLMSSN